jgi:hypothetical protein
MEASVTLGDLLTIVLFLVTLTGGIIKLNARFDAKVLGVLARCDELSRELAGYKLQAAEKYASVEHLKDVEGRLVVSIDRLAERIDRLINRIDRSAERE